MDNCSNVNILSTIQPGPHKKKSYVKAQYILLDTLQVIQQLLMRFQVGDLFCHLQR